MENRRDPNLSTEMFWIGGDSNHRVCTDPHQQIVNLPLVLICDISDRFWQRKDEMEVPHGQQFCLACCQPCLCSTRLTFWAVPVAARVISDVLVCAVFATCDMATEHSRATTFNRRHHFQLVQTDVPGITHAPHRAMVAENVRNLQP